MIIGVIESPYVTVLQNIVCYLVFITHFAQCVNSSMYQNAKCYQNEDSLNSIIRKIGHTDKTNEPFPIRDKVKYVLMRLIDRTGVYVEPILT